EWRRRVEARSGAGGSRRGVAPAGRGEEWRRRVEARSGFIIAVRQLASPGLLQEPRPKMRGKKKSKAQMPAGRGKGTTYEVLLDGQQPKTDAVPRPQDKSRQESMPQEITTSEIEPLVAKVEALIWEAPMRQFFLERKVINSTDETVDVAYIDAFAQSVAELQHQLKRPPPERATQVRWFHDMVQRVNPRYLTRNVVNLELLAEMQQLEAPIRQYLHERHKLSVWMPLTVDAMREAMETAPGDLTLPAIKPSVELDDNMGKPQVTKAFLRFLHDLKRTPEGASKLSPEVAMMLAPTTQVAESLDTLAGFLGEADTAPGGKKARREAAAAGIGFVGGRGCQDVIQQGDKGAFFFCSLLTSPFNVSRVELRERSPPPPNPITPLQPPHNPALPPSPLPPIPPSPLPTPTTRSCDPIAAEPSPLPPADSRSASATRCAAVGPA
ncbi:hypothetical protein CYMTET_26731, partial [Cymbomonas tetramitiformis]